MKLLAVMTTALVLTACGAIQSIIGDVPTPSGPVAGSFASFGVDNYPDCYDSQGNNQSVPAQSQGAATVGYTLDNLGWSDISLLTDPLGEAPVAGPGYQKVSAQSFLDAAHSGASIIFFMGHGDTGDVAFSDACSNSAPANYSYWGVGSSDGTMKLARFRGGFLIGHHAA